MCVYTPGSYASVIRCLPGQVCVYIHLSRLFYVYLFSGATTGSQCPVDSTTSTIEEK